MPEPTETGLSDLENILQNLDSLVNEPNDEEKVNELGNILSNPVLATLVNTYDKLTIAYNEPNSQDGYSKNLIDEILYDLEPFNHKSQGAAELTTILQDPHLEALLKVHDDVAWKNYEFEMEPDESNDFVPPEDVVPVQQSKLALNMIGIKKKPGESLGITVRVSQMGDLIITRVIAGSPIDEQGLLHVGDLIKEVNGEEVTTPQQLQELIRKSGENIKIKIIPAFDEQTGRTEMYVKAHFNYDPKKDSVIPCRDAGLAFKDGDILKVVNMEDSKWWQAAKVDGSGKTGIIPSLTLEEKRQAFVKPDLDHTQKSYLCGIVTKKKKKMLYQAKQNSEFDKYELAIYEEVTKLPPFHRKTLVLIGAQGVGRRTLKQFLLKAEPHRFGSVIPHTCRVKRLNEIDGNQYHFMDKELMEEEIQGNKFLEWGAYEGNYYGTKFESITNVTKQNKMCILDINPAALKGIKSGEFLPFIVFIAAPPVQIMRNMHEFARQRGKTNKIKTEEDFQKTLAESARIEKTYKAYFDCIIVNDNMDETYRKLRAEIDKLNADNQWVPVSWVY
ncbi:DgyrCDS4662 [Dimorphilus gyrociliatus]|uniref:DgyrCDS4662 n=1 Tax=Dimorphilus gyrociliatus TaxID=2664684 RepID=A0A7I8VHA0_9ANNE|nr:DgyrCDS4662 [Dimorphilus gyrociliatus]